MLNFDKLKNTIIELVESKVELKRIEVQEKIENSIADVSFQLIKATLLFTVFIFFSILIAVGINYYYGSPYYGYLGVFVFYLILLFIFIGNKTYFKSKIAEKIAQKVEERFSKKSKL